MKLIGFVESFMNTNWFFVCNLELWTKQQSQFQENLYFISSHSRIQQLIPHSFSNKLTEHLDFELMKSIRRIEANESDTIIDS